MWEAVIVKLLLKYGANYIQSSRVNPPSSLLLEPHKQAVRIMDMGPKPAMVEKVNGRSPKGWRNGEDCTLWLWAQVTGQGRPEHWRPQACPHSGG